MALEKGHRVIAFVRNPKKVPAKWTENKNFTAIRADPPTTAVVQEAIAAHDPHVILSMLSSDQKPHNAVSGAARTTIEALAVSKQCLLHGCSLLTVDAGSERRARGEEGGEEDSSLRLHCGSRHR